MTDKKTDDQTNNKKTDVEVPANAQAAPNQGEQPTKGDESPAQAEQAGDLHVTQHLDRDLNDPRNATPTPQLPSLDDKSQQGPEHGRVSNEDDHTETGQNGPNV